MKTKTTPPKFDRTLSLQIDAIHAAIDEAKRRRQWLRTACLRMRLRMLEARIPA